MDHPGGKCEVLGPPELVRCRCCPYGYHIDLDFVRYCEALYSSCQPLLTPRQVPPPPPPPPPDLLSGDSLKDAVQDFEAAWQQSLASSGRPSVDLIPHDQPPPPPPPPPEVIGVDRNVFLNIRDKVAKSLCHIHSLENKLKYMDELKLKLSQLERDKKSESPQSTERIRQNSSTESSTSSPDLLKEHLEFQESRSKLSSQPAPTEMKEPLLKACSNMCTHRMCNMIKSTRKMFPLSYPQVPVQSADAAVVTDLTMDDIPEEKPKPETKEQGIECSPAPNQNSFTQTNVNSATSHASVQVEPVLKDSCVGSEPDLTTNVPQVELPSKPLTRSIGTESIAPPLLSVCTNTDPIKEIETKNKCIGTGLFIIGSESKSTMTNIEPEKQIETKNQCIGTGICLVPPTRNAMTFTDPEKQTETKNKCIGTKVCVMPNRSTMTDIEPEKQIETKNKCIDTGLFPLGLETKSTATELVEEVKETRNKCIGTGFFQPGVESRGTLTAEEVKPIYQSVGINTEDEMTTSQGSNAGIRVCDKCNEAIYTAAQWALSKKSRIPKLQQSSSKTSPSKIPTTTSMALSLDAEAKKSTDIRTEPCEVDVNETELLSPEPRTKKEPSKEMKAACKVLHDSLVRPLAAGKKQPPRPSSALTLVQRDWFKVAGQKDSNPHTVEDFLDYFEEISRAFLQYVVNLQDSNGNTVIHYAASHGNFDVVSVLLDSKVCNVNIQNKAGYTCLMLVSLLEVRKASHRAVVERLVSLGDVNARAGQNGQTALMLAASQGRIDTMTMLLAAGAEVNLQDSDGSTALMCAAEHGHQATVRALLAVPDCDPGLTDQDGSTALTIAMEAGHKDVGLLLYAATTISRGSSPYASLRGRRRSNPTSSRPFSSAPSTPRPAQRSRTTIY